MYYDYPTGSDSVPDGIDFVGDTTFDAVFEDGGFNPQPNDITDVGVLSPYGTAGQGGNVWEWEETEVDLVNDSTFSFHGARGGSWLNGSGGSTSLAASIRSSGNGPVIGPFTFGFRVVSIPEPSADFDNNGIVDGLDFLKWQRGMSPNALSQSDLALWESQYGGPPPLVAVAAASTAVPEPTTSALALAALCLAMSRRRSF